MKALYLILFLCAFLNVALGELCRETIVQSNVCPSFTVPEGYYRCCYVKTSGKVAGQSAEIQICAPITEEIYKNIDDYIKKSKEEAKQEGIEVDKISVDCRANYLVFSLLSLILFLF